jgi:hypothetical protein
MDELEAEATINLKTKIEWIPTKKAKEIFVEVDREALTRNNNEEPTEGAQGANSVSESYAQTVYGANKSCANTNKKAGTSITEKPNTSSGETLTKGVRFVLDRENCFLMELRVMEKNNIILEQFDKEIKNNGDLNSSKSTILLIYSLQPYSNSETKSVFVLF